MKIVPRNSGTFHWDSTFSILALGLLQMACQQISKTLHVSKVVLAIEIKLKQNLNETEIKRFKNCFKTVLFQFCFSLFQLCGTFKKT